MFVRLSGCNVWNGLEEGRKESLSPCGKYCDTRFDNGTGIFWQDLLHRIRMELGAMQSKLVVITGGEPLLQLRSAAGESFLLGLANATNRIGMETNGSIELPSLPSYGSLRVTIGLSPKGAIPANLFDNFSGFNGSLTVDVKVLNGYPAKEYRKRIAKLAQDAGLGKSLRFWIQPVDTGRTHDPNFQDTSVKSAIHNVMSLNRDLQAGEAAWRLGIQSHKVWVVE